MTKYLETEKTNSTAYKASTLQAEMIAITLLSIMIAFLPYLGYAKYKNYKVQGLGDEKLWLDTTDRVEISVSSATTNACIGARLRT